jgi:uncharacterized protein (TIGR02246 family)
MRTTRRGLLSALSLGAVASRAVADDDSAPLPPPAGGTGRKTIPMVPMEPPFAALRQVWAQCLHAKSVDAIVTLYTEDGVFLNPTGQRLTGRAAIGGLMTKVTQTFDSAIELTSLATERSGALAYDSGTFKETLIDRSSGNAIRTSGSYLQVLRRGDDGHWRIAQQAWTGAEPKAGDGKRPTG